MPKSEPDTMKKPIPPVLLCGLVMAALVVFAAMLRVYSSDNALKDHAATLVRGLIYMGLFTVWGISLALRIIHPKIRSYLLAMAVLMVVWYFIRTCKFLLFGDLPDVVRYCWYCYYIPMLLIPLCGVCAVAYLSKPETCAPDKRLKYLWIPALIVLGMVMTNDLHQLVWRFPQGFAESNENYTYGPGYFMAAVLIAAQELACVSIIVRNCRQKPAFSLAWLPFLPLVCALVYSILYVLRVEFVFRYLGDMTSVLCLVNMMIWESMIQCGMIRSNTNYEKLFRASTAAMQIYDRDYRLCYTSACAKPLPRNILRKTQNAPVVMEDGLRLSGTQIAGGYVIWQEDVSTLTGLLAELKETQDILRENNLLLREEYKTLSRRRHLEEQNRLYDTIQKETRPQIGLMLELLDGLDQAEKPEQKKALQKIAVLGAYIKRLSNLLLLADREKDLSLQDLDLSFKESAENLMLLGAEAAVRICPDGRIPAVHAICAYKFFETVAEATLDTLRTMLVCVDRKEDLLCVAVTVESGYAVNALPFFPPGEVTVQNDEDGSQRFVLTIRLKEQQL